MTHSARSALRTRWTNARPGRVPDGSQGVATSADPIWAIASGGGPTASRGFHVAADIVLAPSTGPPTSTVTVSGTGFGANEGVDVFFDTTNAALAGADGTGNFGPITVAVPGSATPGSHRISAEGRQSRTFAHATFTVATVWPQFRDQPEHHGHNGTENLLSPLTVSWMDLNWSFATNGGVYSSPAVANGVVYVGSEDGNVYALEATTGTELWSYPTNGAVYSSPAVATGVVYVGSEDGNVYALDAATGTKLWSYQTLPVIQSSPAVANGVVYVGSYDYSVHALDAATGNYRWRFDTAFVVFSSPAVANGVVYVGSEDSNVYALDAATGAKRWNFATNGSVQSSPAVANGVVYVGSYDGNLYALGLANMDT
jgi:outer membrane protein assembly factor BamB